MCIDKTFSRSEEDEDGRKSVFSGVTRVSPSDVGAGPLGRINDGIFRAKERSSAGSRDKQISWETVGPLNMGINWMVNSDQ